MRYVKTFKFKLTAGFLGIILAALSICGIAVYGLYESIKSSHIVISDYAEDLILAGRLGVEEEFSVAAGRGYLITGDKTYLERMKLARENFLKNLAILQKNNDLAPQDHLLSELRMAEVSYHRTMSKLVQARLTGVRLRDLERGFDKLQPQREYVQKTVNDYVLYAREQLESGTKELSNLNKSIFRLVFVVSSIALALAGVTTIAITKTLSKSYQEVQGIAKMREEIVEMVAHDLRNPVTAVNLSTQLLLNLANSNGAISSDQLRRRTENIIRATNRVNGLIDGLLDLGKMKAGTLSVERAKVSPNDIVDDTFELFDEIGREKGIILEIKQDSLPLIQCDFKRVVQVFSNLIGNAIKFSVSGQKIIFGARSELGSIVFFVTDQGPGIPKDHQDLVFERYWQSDGYKSAGLGLGLAICKGIVDSHGGKIWLESKIGFGTTFYFSIPIGKTATTETARQVDSKLV